MTVSTLDELLERVGREVEQQIEVWGVRDQRDREPMRSREYGLLELNWLRRANDKAEAEGIIGWKGIIDEEIYKALTELDPEHKVYELIQVAAVAISWAMNVERNIEAANEELKEEENDCS